MKYHRPSGTVSTIAVCGLTILWAYLRLYLFPENVLPLTFVLPLLICIWTGQRWQLWGMTGIFSIMAYVKAFVLLPKDAISDTGDYLFFGSTLFNILVGAILVQAILKLRENLEAQNATILAQNAELETQAEELSQQNEEIKAQAEELNEQNEEIEVQTEETSRQNEDLVELNRRLSGREEILQGLLDASRKSDSIPEALKETCRRALAAIGAPAEAVAVLEQKENGLSLLSQGAGDKSPGSPAEWSLTNTIATVVLKEKRTAYVFDLDQASEFTRPFADKSFRSVLVTPIVMNDHNSGVLAAYSTSPSHWTEEQFRIIEWVAAQCRITMEILRSQKALAEHAQALESANQAKDNFLAMLSHELRTPLTPVLSIAGMLENDEQLPDSVREDFRMIRRNVGVQSKLIDDLLDLTRISRGKIELEHASLPIASLLANAATIVEDDMAAKSLKLEKDLTGLKNIFVTGDNARLQQVFWNLLKNAIKFSSPGTTVIMRGRHENHYVQVEVIDAGCGIAAKDLERIFLPFEQTLEAPRKAKDAGLGLGLAIAKALVELHGGRISVRSEGRGQGTTFIVELPAEIKHVSAPAPDGLDAQTNTIEKSANILLVEDHGDTGRVMVRMLQNAGYKVDHAETAASALMLFKQKEFDLVVSDLGLPDESGLELIKKLRAIQPGLRAICLSGYGMEENIAACHAAGFQEHLTKPAEPGRLKAAIAKLLTLQNP